MKPKSSSENESAKAACGIIMPISTLDGCSETHWSDVLEILTDSIEDAGFEPNLVSNADDVGIIQKRIVQNLYSNEIIVCDVSGKNPNVMFELGMRLAFDRPTVIVKDDKTSYSFDTAPIEHLAYPRDLRFAKIVEFKEKLKDKLIGTHQAAVKDTNYTTFLKHFGEFKIAKLNTREVSKDEFVLDELRLLRRSIARLEVQDRPNRSRLVSGEYDLDVCVHCDSTPEFEKIARTIGPIEHVEGVRFDEREPGHFHLLIKTDGAADPELIQQTIANALPNGRVRVRGPRIRR